MFSVLPTLVLPESHDRHTLPPDEVGLGWPSLLGPAHDCSSPERGLDLQWPESGPFEKWRIPVGAGYSAPVVLGDRLILFNRHEDQEVIDCLDAESGRNCWSTSWPSGYQCPVNYSSGPYSTPVLEDGHVYAIGAEGRLVCLSLEDGTEYWHREVWREYDVKTERWPATASPLLEGNSVIMNLGARESSAGVIVIDKATGETLWTATEDGASCATPRAATIHGKRFAFVWTADALVALEPADGSIYWRIPFTANNDEVMHGTSPLIAEDIVLVSGYQIGSLCVRVLADGSYEELWRDRRELLDSQYNNLLHIDGHVCGFSTTRRGLRCLEPLTGDLRWKWHSRILNGNIISVDGGYLLFGARGRLASLAITTDGVDVIAMTDQPLLKPPTFSYAALHNGLLYLRNEDELLCVDLQPSAPSSSPCACSK